MFEHSIQQLAEEKLYILFVLDEAKLKLSRNTITHIFMENELFDFFSLQQYLYELSEDGFVSVDKKGVVDTYFINDRGREVLSYFIKALPYSKRERLQQYLSEHKDTILHEKEVKSSYKKIAPSIYLVELSLHHEAEVPFHLCFQVPTPEMARTACKNWEECSSDLYVDIINTLLSEKRSK